jgi:Lrp/AsnC family transcriptional regulator, leucine-responsive regulatory protein
LDALDRRILREVQKDCSQSAGILAERTGTTESTALRRLQRLRRDGIIKAEVAIVDGPRIGRGLLVFVNVRLEREDGPGVKAFVDRVRNHPDVLQLHFVTGTPDYIILLAARTMEDYDAFLQEHLLPDPLVVLSETNVVIRPLKMSTVIPVDDPAN